MVCIEKLQEISIDPQEYILSLILGISQENTCRLFNLEPRVQNGDVHFFWGKRGFLESFSLYGTVQQQQRVLFWKPSYNALII